MYIHIYIYIYVFRAPCKAPKTTIFYMVLGLARPRICKNPSCFDDFRRLARRPKYIYRRLARRLNIYIYIYTYIFIYLVSYLINDK